MKREKGWKMLAACAALMLGSITHAGTPAGLATRYGTPPSDDPKLLMSLVGPALRPANINMYGYVEGSYNYNLADPVDGNIRSRQFAFENEDPTLNQVDLNLERVVNLRARKFDLGFHIEGIYGADARLTHSNGMNFYGSERFFQPNPQNQGDILQAYGDIMLPIGDGIRLRVGKFVNIQQFATTNILNSGLSGMPGGGGDGTHSFYTRGILYYPATDTGVLATFVAGREFTIDAGVSRGIDQSLRDNNGSVDFLGAATYRGLDKRSLAQFSIRTGPEFPNDGGTYYTELEVFAAQKIGRDLMVGCEAFYTVLPHAFGGFGNESQYGIGLHGSYTLTKRTTLNSRVEWFRPEFYEDHLRIADDVYEATIGVAVRPFVRTPVARDIVIRPEFRWDFAEQAIYNGDQDRSQLTFSVDAYLMF